MMDHAHFSSDGLWSDIEYRGPAQPLRNHLQKTQIRESVAR